MSRHEQKESGCQHFSKPAGHAPRSDYIQLKQGHRFCRGNEHPDISEAELEFYIRPRKTTKPEKVIRICTCRPPAAPRKIRPCCELLLVPCMWCCIVFKPDVDQGRTYIYGQRSADGLDRSNVGIEAILAGCTHSQREELEEAQSISGWKGGGHPSRIICE